MTSSSTSSLSDATAPLAVPQTGRRRSSFAARIGSFAEAGGSNSFNNFARSWSRATQFYAQRGTPSDDDEVAINVGAISPIEEADVQSQPSELALDNNGTVESTQQASSNPETGRDAIEARLRQRRDVLVKRRSSTGTGQQRQNVFNISRHGSNDVANSLLQQRSHEDATIPSDGAADEETPLISKAAEFEGRAYFIQGESTSAQTSFNLTNALIGMSMLAVPYAIRLSGWIIGITAFTVCAMVTAFTGTLLARAIEFGPAGSMNTYDDLAFVAYGQKARSIVRVLFNLELLAVGVALVLLGADCFHSLVPEVDLRLWKLIVGAVVTPLCALPMRILSVTSVLGIVSSVAIIIIVFTAGLTKSSSPGSLHSPAPTNIWPDDWSQFPKAFGMLMACYGAHGIFPNFYRDMRHPYKFDRTIYSSYGFAWLIQLSLGICGYLMYGRNIRDEISINVFETPGYARWISTLIITAMAVLPLTKIPLNAQPIITTISLLLHTNPPNNKLSTETALPLATSTSLPLRQKVLRPIPYLLTPVLLVSISILIPSFDRVLAVLGNLLCCLISVVLPCLFHLRLYSGQLPMWRKALEWTLVVVFAIPAIVGTVYSVLPA